MPNVKFIYKINGALVSVRQINNNNNNNNNNKILPTPNFWTIVHIAGGKP